MKYIPRHHPVALPVSRISRDASRAFSHLVKTRMTSVRYVWFAAALLFGLNLAVVFSPTFAPRAATQTGPVMGPASGELVSILEQMGLAPAATVNINKDAFSVEGTLVAMAGDNIQIFEYPSTMAATRESTTFLEEGRAGYEMARAWERQASIYSKDTLVVYYMGANQKIIRALSAAMGPPLAGGGTSAFESEDGQ